MKHRSLCDEGKRKSIEMKYHDVVAAFAFVTAKNAEKNDFFIFKLAAFAPEKLFFCVFNRFFFHFQITFSKLSSSLGMCQCFSIFIPLSVHSSNERIFHKQTDRMSGWGHKPFRGTGVSVLH